MRRQLPSFGRPGAAATMPDKTGICSARRTLPGHFGFPVGFFKSTWVEEGTPHPDPLPAGEGDALTPARFREERGSMGRWRAYDYKVLVNRDKASLDIFWLKDESLSESDNLPEPGVIAAEIVEDLEAALEQFRQIAADLNEDGAAAE